MSVSIDNEASENTQQNEEQEVETQNENQEIVAQNEDQETAVQTIESLAPDTINNSQANKFDFEKSKDKLEYISIVLALISVISTGMVKVLSVGSHLCFSFDIDNYEFKLTNNDLIIFFLSMFFCIFAIVFCQKTTKIKNKINIKINNCCESEGKFKIKKLLGAIGWIIVYCLLICSYLFLGKLIIDLLCGSKDVSFLKNILQSTYSISFILVLLFFIITIAGEKITKIVFVVLGAAAFLLISSIIINANYEKALNQREFEIIVAENDEGQSQEYVVISKGNSYSAYQCSAEDQNNGKVLIIHTDRHRFFPLDDTETRLNIFDEYQLYKYGEPLDTNEENNSEEYQGDEE